MVTWRARQSTELCFSLGQLCSSENVQERCILIIITREDNSRAQPQLHWLQLRASESANLEREEARRAELWRRSSQQDNRFEDKLMSKAASLADNNFIIRLWELGATWHTMDCLGQWTVLGISVCSMDRVKSSASVSLSSSLPLLCLFSHVPLFACSWRPLNWSRVRGAQVDEKRPAQLGGRFFRAFSFSPIWTNNFPSSSLFAFCATLPLSSELRL